MELFHEIKNSNYSFVRNWYNRFLQVGEALTLQEYQTQKASDAWPVDILAPIELDSLFAKKIDKDSNETVFEPKLLDVDVSETATIPILFTLAEKRYLKTVLAQPEICAFLSKESEACWNELLAGVKELPIAQVFAEKSCTAADYTQAEQTHLLAQIKQLTQIILQGQCISYTYHTRAKVTKQKQGKPQKLLYSMKSQLWQVMMQEEYKGRAQMTLCNILQMEQIQAQLEQERGNIAEDVLVKSKAKEPLILKVKPIYQSVERCLYLFNDYEKEVRYYPAQNEQQDDFYQVAIDYYRFDENVLLKDILSLGDAVEIVSPLFLRNQMIARLEKITFA